MNVNTTNQRETRSENRKSQTLGTTRFSRNVINGKNTAFARPHSTHTWLRRRQVNAEDQWLQMPLSHGCQEAFKSVTGLKHGLRNGNASNLLNGSRNE